MTARPASVAVWRARSPGVCVLCPAAPEAPSESVTAKPCPVLAAQGRWGWPCHRLAGETMAEEKEERQQ